MTCTIRNILACILGFIVFLPGVASSETVTLELKMLNDRSQFTASGMENDFLYRMTYPQHHLYNQSQNANGENPSFSKITKKEPDSYQCKHPFRGVFKFGDFDYPFVLDGKNLDSSGYDTLYFDANRNGDLTDDPKIQANDLPQNIRFGNHSAHREFPRQTIKVTAGEKSYDYSFFVQVYSNTEMNMGPNTSLYAYASINSAAYREGEVSLNGKTHHLVLLDFNSNGRFDDQPEVNTAISKSVGRYYTQPTDMLLVNPDLNNRDSFGYNLTGRKERQPVSKLLNIDGTFYQMQVSANGETLSLTPSKVGMGKVKNPNKKYSAVVFGDQGFLKIDGSGSEPVSLPEGKWKLLEYMIDLTDPNDKVARVPNRPQSQKPYTLVSAYGSPKGPEVTVKKNETVVFPFGPPYHPQVDLMKLGGQTNSNEVRLEMKLLGSTGELCSSLQVKGSQPPGPTFVIASPEGEIVERGKFEYG